MRKLALALILILVGTYPAFAELSIGETLKKIPSIKQGIGYNVADCTIDYLATVEVAKYKGFSFEVGYNSSDKAVGVISYEVLNLKNLGVTVPIVDLLSVNVGYYVGWGRIQLGEGQGGGNNELAHGPSLTLIDVKW